ncbi:spore-associated protein [Streptomyces nigra]|uniref:spore-associated protein n=1 Tax=Streptomyces nigra TaxID=1827580 RepID=UPI0036B79652
MSSLRIRIAASLGVTAVALGTVVATAPAASAATYLSSYCGTGYAVVNSADVGSLGTVYLTYNASNGQNCVVTVRHASVSGSEICEGITPAGGRESSQCEPNVSTWGGPVYVRAEGVCVSWWGTINGVKGGKNNTNCG